MFIEVGDRLQRQFVELELEVDLLDTSLLEARVQACGLFVRPAVLEGHEEFIVNFFCDTCVERWIQVDSELKSEDVEM